MNSEAGYGNGNSYGGEPSSAAAAWSGGSHAEYQRHYQQGDGGQAQGSSPMTGGTNEQERSDEQGQWSRQYQGQQGDGSGGGGRVGYHDHHYGHDHSHNHDQRSAVTRDGQPPATLHSNERSFGKGTTSTARARRVTSASSKWRGLSYGSIVFLAIVLLEALAVIGLVVSVFAIVEHRTLTLTQDAKTVPVFLALFVFGMLWFVILVLDAFRLSNAIQIMGCVVYNIALLVTAALEVTQIRTSLENQDRFGSGVLCPGNQPPNTGRRCGAVRTLYPAIQPQLIATAVIIGVAQLPLTWLMWKVSQDHGWQIYKMLGADLGKRRMMLIYQVFVVFLKFDFFFGTAFCIAYLILVSDRDDAEFGLTIAALPAAVAALLSSAFAVRKEIYSLMSVCIVIMFAGGAYFIYKLTRIFSSETEEEYRTVRLSMTFFSVFSIVSLAATIVLAILCTVNFGRGLKEAHESMGGLTDRVLRLGVRERGEKSDERDGDEHEIDLGGDETPNETGLNSSHDMLGVPQNHRQSHHQSQQQNMGAAPSISTTHSSAYAAAPHRTNQSSLAASSQHQQQKQAPSQAEFSSPSGPRRRVSLD